MQDFVNLPIGVVDSGIGGLSVLDKLVKSFPGESFLYYGDNDNSPYGNKPLSYIKERVDVIINSLYKRGIIGLVIACNTVSTHFYNEIKNNYPFFVIPTIPPLIKGEGVYLACTSNTAKSDYIKENYKNNVISFPCLAKTIEENVFNLDSFNVCPYFENFKKELTTLVLGCTHYSFIAKNISAQLGVKTIDGYDKIVKSLNCELKTRNLYNAKPQTITFLGSQNLFNKTVYERVFCNSSGHKCKKN